MEKLINTTDLVKTILTEKPETRDDDYLLWAETILETIRKREYPYIYDLTLLYTLKHIHKMGLPPFQSVSRARRKLQAKYPELRGSDRARRGRAKKEKTFKEYAKI